MVRTSGCLTRSLNPSRGTYPLNLEFILINKIFYKIQKIQKIN